jgi:hypothetical protein
MHVRGNIRTGFTGCHEIPQWDAGFVPVKHLRHVPSRNQQVVELLANGGPMKRQGAA